VVAECRYSDLVKRIAELNPNDQAVGKERDRETTIGMT
jgi:hypothetical protein